MVMNRIQLKIIAVEINQPAKIQKKWSSFNLSYISQH